MSKIFIVENFFRRKLISSKIFFVENFFRRKNNFDGWIEWTGFKIFSLWHVKKLYVNMFINSIKVVTEASRYWKNFFPKTRSFDSIGKIIFRRKFFSSKIFFRRKTFWSKIHFRRKKFRRKKVSTKKSFDEKNRCQ